MDKKQIGQRVKLARVFYEQKTGNKMTQEILANKTGTKRDTCNIPYRVCRIVYRIRKGDIYMSSKKLNLEGNLFNMGSVNESVNNVSDVVNNVNISVNKKEEKEFSVPMTYRLYPSTIKKIKKLSHKAEMGVSEFLQIVLDEVLDKIEID